MATMLLAHSCPAARAGMRSALSRAQGIELVAEAGDGEEALRLLLEKQPDIALLACWLPGPLDGAKVAEQVRAAGRSVHILVLCAPGDTGLLCRMWRAGAVGCISDRAGLDTIIRTAGAAVHGRPLWTREQVARLERWWSQVGSRLEVLTEREGQVLALIARALSNREIGRRLGLSENTVETHVRNVLSKLQLATRQEAIVFVLKQGDRRRPDTQDHGFP